MTAYATIPVIAAAGTALLFLGRWVMRRGGARLVRNPEVDRQLLYQPLSVGIAATTVFIITLLLPESASYFHVGTLRTPVVGLSWMGIASSDSWLTIGIPALRAICSCKCSG